MIDYSLGVRLSNPTDKNSEKRVYPYPQVREVLSLEKLAKHIASHGSPYTRDVILGVITATVDCIREQLLAGNKVQVGELGAFYITFTCEGVDNADDFNPQSHISAVNVRWDRGNNFADMKQVAEFNYVASRNQQAEAKKTEKQSLNVAIGIEDPNNPGGNSGTGDDNDVTD